MTSKPTDTKPIEQAKKPYQPPQLEVFGDLKAVTQNVDAVGANDGGMSLMTKT